MQSVIVRLNQMSQLTQFKNEEVNLRAVLEDVREVLRLKLKDVNFVIAGDLQVDTNRSFIFSVILNLVMNSLEVFESRQIKEPNIEVSLSVNKLTFIDNGGGFTSEVLEKIKSGISASTKTEASGLGLFLLIDGVRNMGGKVFCSNTPEGARIIVQFNS
jgi:two-component system sensor histidine kinase RegB